MTANISWSVFTREEHDALNKMLEMGEFKSFAQAVVEMTPEKEFEIQKLTDSFANQNENFESEAHAQWRKEQQKKTNGASADPQTPEEEAELQKILDDEMKAKQEELQMKNLEREEALNASQKNQEKAETENEEETNKTNE